MTWNRDEVLAPVEERDRNTVAVYANGECNMCGGRYSDALRSQVRDYVRMGREAYLEREESFRRNSSFYPNHN